jgi:hypothetical protein
MIQITLRPQLKNFSRQGRICIRLTSPHVTVPHT